MSASPEKARTFTFTQSVCRPLTPPGDNLKSASHVSYDGKTCLHIHAVGVQAGELAGCNRPQPAEVRGDDLLL